MTQLLRAIVDEATAARLPFLVIGGTAVNALGHARLTLDLDLMIPRRDVELWSALLERIGYRRIPEQIAFAQFSPPFEGMWPVDLMLVNDSTFQKASAAACDKVIDGIPVKVPAVLDLIAMKLHALRYGKPDREAKDLTDIYELVQFHGIDVTSDLFRTVCDKYGTTQLYERIQRALANEPPGGTTGDR
jgi:hypothetical protein